MKILLTLPPDIHKLEIYRITGMRAPPLGLATIAAVLEKAGHKVKIIDSPTLMMTSKQWISIVKLENPDIIGISLLTPIAPKGYNAIKMLKDERPDIPVIVGGPHPTFMIKEALENNADIVVMGEGELTMLETVQTLEKSGLDPEALSKVKGIAYKQKDGKTRINPPRPLIMNLDQLPWPARHLLPMEKYTLFNKPIKVAHIMASRGCPYGCIYCTTSYFWGRKVRFRTARNVLGELEQLIDKYKVKYLVFTDDELAINKRFIREFITGVKERGLDIPFACGARVDHLNREFIKYLHENNCVTIYVGVESANQETINKIGKRITIEQVKKVFEWKKEIGAFILGSFILGFPWETVDDMKKTVEFAIELDPDYAQFTALTPYPGTPLYEYAKKNNLIEDWNWEHYTTIRPVMRGYKFTTKELGKMIAYAYRKFYLRKDFIVRELHEGRLKNLLGIFVREIARYIKDIVVHPMVWRSKL